MLAEMAQPLKDAGLTRVTVSMDAVDPDRFARITRVPNGYDHVLAGIRAARRAGIVAAESELRAHARLQRRPDHSFRHVRARRRRDGAVHRIHAARRRTHLGAFDRGHARGNSGAHGASTGRWSRFRTRARRRRGATGSRMAIGEIGIIAPVSHPFCGHCSRIRITSDGKIRTCLFSVWDHDLHAQMRRGASDDELAEFIQGVVAKKEERHHIGEPDFVPASRTMVHIGG